ncbi:OmpA family protein [Frigoriflavimonas asaccharolytica]|uniref:OOP family OmpA-OmpF porin n=1 Tax=Frigoriflavimonas asaccharolytica TaxID=2735899 RepID=A0A8J8K8V7_9FLAO|nr:OmpA family protein [Frigoriflavimonas asaccharolytica]NRS92372.1 OOP family OmpA-OmpF porin [Frigoriflavimonas asaccharolytica]
MKINLAIVALALAIPTASFAQMDSVTMYQTEYPNTFSSGSANVSPFTKDSKRFNDWSISAGAGVPLVQSADLTSIKNGNGTNVFGYSAYLSVDKAITHAFGLKLQYDRGETRQGAYNTKTDNAPTTGNPFFQVAGRTQYDAISILGDINFSNLLRRVDNKSPLKWALHGYAGIGTLAYKAYQENASGQSLQTEVKPFKFYSFFGQAGVGLKYKVNNRIDLEVRSMYVVTGDDEFDGGGAQYSAINLREDQISDNFFNTTLGVSLKLGKHTSHLMWHDPLQEIYYKLDVLADKNQDVEVCKSGDNDNDGVCDDWDRQLDTPAGARVDGAGVALDTDLDGVIDLYDKCVVVPGPVENDGCPYENTIVPPTSGGITEEEISLDPIEFDLNSDRILPSNTSILNNAVKYINSTNGGSYKVIGATDTRASEAYNQKLSERRANSVKSYLIQNGVESNKLQAEGRGEKDLKYPECEPATKCPEWKNRANRRVFFEAK